MNPLVVLDDVLLGVADAVLERMLVVGLSKLLVLRILTLAYLLPLLFEPPTLLHVVAQSIGVPVQGLIEARFTESMMTTVYRPLWLLRLVTAVMMFLPYFVTWGDAWRWVVIMAWQYALAARVPEGRWRRRAWVAP